MARWLLRTWRRLLRWMRREKPVVLSVDLGGYLISGEDDAVTPRRREAVIFGSAHGDELSLDEIRGFLLEDGQIESGDPLATSDAALNAWLDEPVDPGEISETLRAMLSNYGLGIVAFEEIVDAAVPISGEEGFELRMIDGDGPFSDFIGVEFNGDPHKFNQLMVREGLDYRIAVSPR